MDCKFKLFGRHQLKCSVCHKTMPKVNNWQNLRRNCSGAPPNPGTILQQWDFTKRPSPPPDISGGKPGTELKGVLSRLGIAVAPTCDCNAKAQQMDAWGVAGCRQRRDTIIQWLRDGQGRWKWSDKLRAAGMALANGLAFKLNPLDPYPGLVDESIRLAAAKEVRVAIPYIGPVRRNLLMFIYPRVGDEWKRNIDLIKQRIHLFNGRRVFAVAVDNTTVWLNEVLAELKPLECEVMTFQNSIGEVTAFSSLLESVESLDPDEITYYCHAKGVTKQETDSIQSIQRWTDAMHEVLLDGVDDVEEALTTHMFAGAFRSTGKQFANLQVPFYNWHYPGTFYWFRNCELFAQPNWNNVQQQYYGTEAWPGTQVPLSRGACLLTDGVPLAGLYHAEQWQTRWQPALDRWRAKRAERTMV